MKIGIVCYPTFGGSGVLATELGMALADKGHEIHFITYQQPVRLINSFRPNIFFHEVNVPVYPLFDFPPYESALISTMVSVAKEYGLDILHVHYAIPHASAAFFAQKILEKEGKGVPFITTLHGTDITLVGKDANYEPIVTFSINESNAITAVSQNLKDETNKSFNITKEIEVIYNFVDTKRFNREASSCTRKSFAPNGEKILVHVSNFRAVKRVQDVIQVFNKIKQTMPAKLLMIGDGPERLPAEELTKQLCCTHNDVLFMGKQENMADLFTLADLFVLPSAYESFGLAALEAMASGVPVLSSNAGGLPEVNIHGKTGYLADVGDVDTMAAHAIELLTDEAKLATFKENAYQHAQTFTIEHVIPEYENLYNRVINEYNA